MARSVGRSVELKEVLYKIVLFENLVITGFKVKEHEIKTLQEVEEIVSNLLPNLINLRSI